MCACVQRKALHVCWFHFFLGLFGAVGTLEKPPSVLASEIWVDGWKVNALEVVELVGSVVGATDFGGGVACFVGRTEDFAGAVTGALVVEAAAGILLLGPV